MSPIVVIIAIIVLGIAIHNLIIVRRLLALSKISSHQLSDERYFGLKSKIELYTIVFSILIAVLAYLGINSYNEITNRVQQEMLDKLSIYDNRLGEVDSILTEVEKFVRDFDIEREAISTVLATTSKDAKELEQNINVLAQRKITSINLILVPDVDIDLFEDKEYHFKDMVSLSGRKLPIFSKAPRVYIPSGIDGISEVTKDYFKMEIHMQVAPIKKVDLLIITTE